MQFAMKVICDQSKKNRKRVFDLHMQTFEIEFKREVQFLRSMNHPHIVKMINAKVEDEDRPKSGESKKSNRSNNSSSGEEQDQKLKSETGEF